jgi:hypothetical protein
MPLTTNADCPWGLPPSRQIWKLESTIHTLPASGGAVHSVKYDNSQFVVTALHAEPKGFSGRLLAVSPGLFPAGTTTSSNWSLVQVDPQSGAVAVVAPVPSASQTVAKTDFGGNVVNAIIPCSDDPRSLCMIHVFTYADGRNPIRVSMNYDGEGTTEVTSLPTGASLRAFNFAVVGSI